MKREPFAFDINKMPRSRKAWERVISVLNDGKWHYYPEILHLMLEASDIKPHSCIQLIREMLKQELIREDPSGRWLFRVQFSSPDLKWPEVYNSPDGVRTKQEEE